MVRTARLSTIRCWKTHTGDLEFPREIEWIALASAGLSVVVAALHAQDPAGYKTRHAARLDTLLRACSYFDRLRLRSLGLGAALRAGRSLLERSTICFRTCR